MKQKAKPSAAAQAAMKRTKLLDGARFWNDDDLPQDHLSDPVTGLRPGRTSPPVGTTMVRLDSGHSLDHCILPTRANWKKGHWKTNNQTDVGTDAYYTWVVSGDGTPGNFVSREYVLPSERATEAEVPKHPADWPKKAVGDGWKPKKATGDGLTVAGKTPNKAPSLPFGIRFRCPGCGHWYKESDLAGHAQVCPKEGEADWAIACECCTSLDDTAKPKKGFPRAVAKPKANPESKAEEPKKEAKESGSVPAS